MTARTATILVTDLVGSTEQRVRLGEERAEALRQVHDRLAAEAVTSAGGIVVKGLGDGVLASFGGAAEAVSAAVAMQRSAAAHTKRHPEAPLILRAGISAGDVETDGADVFGTPVVEAARLCSQADAGQILVAELVRSLARGRGGHEFRGVGSLQLKGLPDPLPTVEVIWSTGTRRALPSLLEVTRSSGMVGRQPERERLLGLWRRTSTSGRQVALVAGEPGIGKTRLVAELAGDAVLDDGSVVYGHCDEELAAPYRPWIEVVQSLLAMLPPDVTSAHRAQTGGALDRLVPSLATERARDGDAETERLRLFGAVTDLIGRAAARAPLLVLLDDIHWADRSSLLLLRHLLLEPSDLPWLLVATYRDTEVSPRDRLAATLADLRRVAGVERLVLGGLDAEAVEHLVDEQTDHELEPHRVTEIATWLETETAGNPLFIGEVVSHLLESGAALGPPVGANHRGRVDDVSVPDGVRDAVARRLASLREDAAEILMAAAVVGSEFDAAIVAEVLARPVDVVLEAIEPMLPRRLLVEVPERFGRYRFTHALVRQTLEQELSRTRRVRLHHRIALVLEQAGAPATELARHFLAGAAEGDADRAVAWSRRAANEALDSLAYDEAVASYRMALDAMETAGAREDEERAAVLMLLAGAANRAGDDDSWRHAALDAAVIARRLGDPERLGNAALSLLGTLGSVVGVDEEVVAVVHDAASLLRAAESRSAHPALLAELLARLGAYLASERPAESAALFDEALEIARCGGDPRALAIALLNSTHTYALDHDAHRARVREAAQLADEGGDPDVVLAASTSSMIGALLWADRDEFDRSLAEYARVAGEMGAVTPLLLNAINHAGAAALDGRYTDARAEFASARRRAVSLRDPTHVVATRSGMITVDRELGRDVSAARETASAGSVPILEAHRAWALSEAGEREEAAERLHALLAEPDALRSGYLRRVALAFLAEATAALEDTTAAAQLAPWLHEETRHGTCVNMGAHAYFGALGRYEGLVALTMGRSDEAVGHHERALDVHEKMRARGWAARSRYDLARALLARRAVGDVERAVGLIESATDVARDLGMSRLLEEMSAVPLTPVRAPESR